MEIVLTSVKDIEKYNPYEEIDTDIEDEYFEDRFLEYFQSFCREVDKLKVALGSNFEKSVDLTFKKIVKKRNDEVLDDILWHYREVVMRANVSDNENSISKLKYKVRIIKDMILISESANMHRLQKVDTLMGRSIDEVSDRYCVSNDIKFGPSKVTIEKLMDNFKPSDSWDFENYSKYVSSFKLIVNEIREHYRNNYSVARATRYIRKLDMDVDLLLDSKGFWLFKAEEAIELLVDKYSRINVSLSNYENWISNFNRKIEELNEKIKNSFSGPMSNVLIDKLEKRSGKIKDRISKDLGIGDNLEDSLKVLFSQYKPEDIDIFDLKFYFSSHEMELAKQDYQTMLPEQQKVFEMRIYEKYIRMFKAKIREHNRDIRKYYSSSCANKMINSVNRRADKLICNKANEIGKPVPRNPWFIRKYLWADTDNFMSKRGLKIRQLFNPLMRKIVQVAMKNKLVIEERTKLDPTKKYVFVPTHYFTEDIIGEYASLGSQAYVLMGTTDQIENNILMLAAIMMGLFYVDRDDIVSRRECVDKQNKIIEYGSNVVNYVGGSWENSENELQPLSFSGPYRTSVAKGVEIVPVGLYLVREEKKIYVRYGDPLSLSKMDEVCANEVIRDTLASIHFKQMSKHSTSIETIEVDGYGKTHNLPYDQHVYYMNQVGNEYWGQYWSKPFAKEEIGVRAKKTIDEADVYSFVDNLSRENLIRLSKYLAEPMLRRYERDERYNIVKYIDENYDMFKINNTKKKVRRKNQEK